jgi:hypothetical protein
MRGEIEMKLDEHEFFREATLRICGNLEIEEALFSSFQFLREVMPVDMQLKKKAKLLTC